MEKRIIAFDIGDKRIGIAASDPFNTFALPGETYFRTKSAETDAEALAKIVREKDAGLIVCGLPVNFDGHRIGADGKDPPLRRAVKTEDGRTRRL